MISASAIDHECRSAGISDVGRVRTNNEDRIHHDDTAGLYFIVDGVGGEAAGERAAEIARRTLIENIDPEASNLPERIRVAIALAGKKIFEAASQNPQWAGMSCVLTVAVVRGLKATVGHVGDSRLYKIRAGAIEKITHDHSPVGQMEDNGRIGESDARAHPRRNEIFRDVGSRLRPPMEDDFIETSEIEVERDSALLLCSDGLTDEIGSGEILDVVRSFAGDRWRIARELVALANRRGGRDNVSVVYVEGPDFAIAAEAPAETSRRRKSRYRSSAGRFAWLHLLFAVIVGALLGAAVAPVLLPPAVPERSSSGGVLVVSPNVDGAYRTINDAIQAARSGDVVELLPGVYSERIQLKTGVWVVGRVPGGAELRPQSGAESSVPGVLARGVRDTGLAGVRVKASAVHEGSLGVLIEDSEAALYDVEITGMSEAAVAIRGKSSARVHNADLHDNTGAGVVVQGPARLELTGSHLFRNGSARATRAAVELGADAGADFRGNVFAANAATLKSADPKFADAELRKGNVVADAAPAQSGR